MNKVIIFGNSHHNTLGLVRSLGEKGIRPILFLEPCDLRFCCVRFSKYIAKIHYLKSLEDGLRVLREEYGKEAEKPIVLNAGDPSMCLLDAHYDELKEHFCIFNANGEQGRINFYMDKSNQFPEAEKCGLNLIKTWRIKDPTNLPTDIAYPCLIKGNNSTSSSKEDMYVCQDRNDLVLHLKDSGEYLVQEYIEKDYELDIVGFSWNHGGDVYIPAVIRKIRDDIHRQSAYERLEDSKDYINLDFEKIKALVRVIGYEGIFSVETIFHNNKYYFLEINLRNDGCGWLYTVAGANYPYMWYQYCTEGIADNTNYGGQLKIPSYMMSAEDFHNCYEGKVPLIAWIKQWLTAEAHTIRDGHDIKPYLYLLFIFVRQAVKRVFKIIFRRRNNYAAQD